jgi:hypothetical protein
MKKVSERKARYAVCVRNKGYPASLELRKLYRIIPDAGASEMRQFRVIDESGEDYLYPAGNFAKVSLPLATKRAIKEVS